jgi:hypothetical protein
VLVLAVTTVAVGGPGVAAAGERAGELRVRPAVEQTGSAYVEGAFQFVAVERARDGRSFMARRTLRSLRLALPAGYYRVRSWTRTCSGTCAVLDPRIHSCRAQFRVRAGRFTTATVTYGAGIACRVKNP